MANRPKSLNELNNLYDKSKEAQNAIKKQSSAITDADSTSRASSTEADFSAEVPVVVSASQIASQEISDAVNEFIKNFGETKDPLQNKPVARPQAPIPKVVKRTPQRPRSEKKAAPADNPAAAKPERRAPVTKEKPVLISNAEKSELFAEYKRIMNDEDDDSSGKNKIKQKKKSKKDKHTGSPVFDSDTAAAPASEKSAPEVTSEKKDEKPSSPDTTPITDKKAAKKEAKKAKAEKKKTKQEKKDTGRKIFQILIMFVLLAVLTSAVGTSLMKVVVGVDSGKIFADKYYFFTASSTYDSMGIYEGDFIITEQKQLDENAMFVYMENNLVKFALKGTQLSDDVLMAHNDGEVKQIPTSQVKGAVVKTIPKLGTVAAFAVDNFLILIAVLVTISLALILVLAFAFKGGASGYDYDDEDDEEIEEEEESDVQHDNGYENEEECQQEALQQDSEVTDETADSYEDVDSYEDAAVSDYSDSDDQYEDYFKDDEPAYEYSDDPYFNSDEDFDDVEISYDDEEEKSFGQADLFSSID